MSATTTREAMKTLVIQLMNETSNNNTYTASDRDSEKINDVVRRVCSWYVRSALNTQVMYKCLDMPFLRKRQYFQNKDAIALTEAVTPWDDEIFLDTTNLEATGAIYCQWCVMPYTGKTATSITGVSWVISAFDSGTYVTKAFPVNADFDKSYRLFHQYNNIQREVFEVQREDERYQRAKYRSFVVVLDEDTGNKYIVVRGFSNNDRFLLKYYATVEDMTEDTDICVIPDEWAKSVICPIAAWELLMESQSEDAEYVNKLTLWYARLEEMYYKFTTQEVDMDKLAKQKPYNYTSINSFGMANTRYTRSWFTVY